MSFFTDESGVETSQPREGIEIVLPNETMRICTGTRDMTIGGYRYTAEPSARTEIPIPQGGESQMPSMILPTRHAFVQRYMRGTVPPRFVAVNLHRLQLESNESEVIWRGKITSVRFEGDLASQASFSLASRLLSVIRRRVPQFAVGRTCGNILFDPNCQVARASFKVSTTIAAVAGAKITLASIGGNPDQWARNGELVHGPSGERMPIADQTGAVVTLQWPVVGWSTGGAVEVFAGCDQSIEMCHEKFANRALFNGSPYLNRDTLRSPPGFGVYTSE